jgi:hypothetical protein
MSRQSAYNLRNRTTNRAFHVAWTAAEQLARRRVSADVLSRAIHGCVELIVRDGEVVAERHRFDNRHTMAVLARLDRQAEALDEENRAARLVAQEFDQFLDIVCAGGDGAAEFVQARQDADWSPGRPREASLLERADNYRRYGVGLGQEIDVSDLDPEAQERWTDEQRERAQRAGLLDNPEAAEDSGTAAAGGGDSAEAQSAAASPAGASGPSLQADPGPWTNRFVVQTTEADSVPSGSGAEDAAPAVDAGPPPHETPDAVEPAPVETREQATCLPEQYDPRSGLLPPDGWVPPKR